MAEREGTPEDFARLAASLRGESQTRKAEEERRDAAPEPVSSPLDTGSQPESEDTEAQEFIERLFAPKPGEAEFIRRLHPEE
jgi:hypothetical protein